jgi:hypothetical protein
MALSHGSSLHKWEFRVTEKLVGDFLRRSRSLARGEFDNFIQDGLVHSRVSHKRLPHGLQAACDSHEPVANCLPTAGPLGRWSLFRAGSGPIAPPSAPGSTTNFVALVAFGIRSAYWLLRFILTSVFGLRAVLALPRRAAPDGTPDQPNPQRFDLVHTPSRWRDATPRGPPSRP